MPQSHVMSLGKGLPQPHFWGHLRVSLPLLLLGAPWGWSSPGSLLLSGSLCRPSPTGDPISPPRYRIFPPWGPHLSTLEFHLPSWDPNFPLLALPTLQPQAHVREPLFSASVCLSARDPQSVIPQGAPAQQA